MVRLELFILATLFSSACSLIVLVDSSYCVHLSCEWRGVGKYCKPATSVHQDIQQDGMRIPFLSDNESEASMLTRVQAQYPVNTFTVAKYADVGAQGPRLAMKMYECKSRWLWCNAAWMYVEEDYDTFLKLIQAPAPYIVPPKLQCRPSFPNH